MLDSGGHSPFSVAVTDVNRDGVPDIVVANCSSGLDLCNSNTKGSIAVLLGGIGGTFQPARKYPSSALPFGLAAADVNGDAWPDLAVASYLGVDLLLNTAGRLPTKLTMSTSGTPSFVGQAVTFTATVMSQYGAIPDGDLVTFYDGTPVIGIGVTASGVATFTTSALTGKAHTIKATYAGDAKFEPSTGSVKQVVNKYPTTTTLRSSLNPSQFGQSVTFTATVIPSGSYALAGTVKFFDGTVGIGSATLSGGVGKLTKSTLAVGTHPITAQYLGDSFNDKSTASVLNQVVQ